MRKNLKSKIQNSKLSNEQGFVLVISLLLLVVATVIGMLALATSTTEVMIAGNARLREINFSLADSGIELSRPIIENTVFNEAVDLTRYPIINDTNLATELVGITGSIPNPDNPANNSSEADIRFRSGVNTILVDIDYYFASPPVGGAIEFASGYEGLGKGAGAGGAQIYYRINSYSVGPLGSMMGTGALYRYVTK